MGARYDLNLVSFFRNISSKKSKNRSFSRFVDHMADFFGKNWLLSKGGERGEILVPRIAEAVGAAPRAACSQLFHNFFRPLVLLGVWNSSFHDPSVWGVVDS